MRKYLELHWKENIAGNTRGLQLSLRQVYDEGRITFKERTGQPFQEDRKRAAK